MVFAITLRSGELVGAIGLSLGEKHRRGELGYWIGKAFWNNGYCTEAVQAVVRYGFEEHRPEPDRGASHDEEPRFGPGHGEGGDVDASGGGKLPFPAAMRRPSRPPSMAAGGLLLTIVLAGACSPEPEPGRSPEAPAVPASETAMTWPDPDSAVAWQSWGPAAFDEARRRGLPVLLYVSGPGCGGLFAGDEGVAAWNAETRFLPVRIDPERHPSPGAPLRPGGVPVDQRPGLHRPGGGSRHRCPSRQPGPAAGAPPRPPAQGSRPPLGEAAVPRPPAAPALGGGRPQGRGLRLRRAVRRLRRTPQVPRAAGDRLPPGPGGLPCRPRGASDGAAHPRRGAGQPPLDLEGGPELLPHARLEKLPAGR